MRIPLLLLFLLITSTVSKAQTWSEWFEQKDTQIKYLLEQIVSLRMYGNFVLKGYDIAEHGLANIKNIKKGDYALHNNFIAALSEVNPVVKDYAKVGGIISHQLKILAAYRNHKRLANSTKHLSIDEIAYCKKVYDNLLQDCNEILKQLVTLITSSHLQMSDAERLRKIDTLYEDITDQYAFARSFQASTAGLVIQRMKERDNVKRTKLMYNIK